MSNRVKVVANGPLILYGEIELQDGQGNVLERSDEIGLCRCGASQRKPYCDGSHKTLGFTDPGEVVDDKAEALAEPAPLIVQARANAMYIARGPMTIEGREGTQTTRNKAALCRCGASQRKPFCDVSHKACGFKAE